VVDVDLIERAMHDDFNEAARQAALVEAFEPATRDGVPIPYSVTFTYRFRLEDE
jgi:hypothetical protein